MSEQFPLPMPREDADSIKLEASVISPAEAQKVESLATLTSQTINSMYGAFIPQETQERNYDVGKRIVVTDDITAFRNVWSREPLGLSEVPAPDPEKAPYGFYYQYGGLITILNPEISWERHCPDCKAHEIKTQGSKNAAKELYKGRFYTTYLAHEEAHQYQDFSLPSELREMGAYYYASEIARKLGHRPFESDLAGKRYDAYAKLLTTYGTDVHRVFFGSVNNPIVLAKKHLILREAAKQKDVLFPNGWGLAEDISSITPHNKEKRLEDYKNL